jgi:tetratricopeptide (TPR) repeat protein
VTRKHAGKKDSAENDREELSALIRSIKLSQKYYLFFVACNQIPRQTELIADIKAKLPTKNIEVISFKEPVTNLLTELKQTLKDKSPDAIFVQGLGNSISSDGIGKENALIHSLNLTRDSFNDAFQCPIYLWLPEYAVIKITRNAPDYFSVRSGVFYFSSTAEQVISDIFQSTSSEWLETSSLPVADKQKRIAMLESLLAEYQGLHEEKRDKNAEARLLSTIGNLFYSLSNYREATKYNEKTLVIAIETGDKEGEGKVLANLGSIYLVLGKYDKAIEFYKKALRLFKKIGNREEEGNHSGNLGIAFSSLGEYQKAIKHFKVALKIAKEVGNQYGEGFVLGNLGVTYKKLGKYKEAIKYYNASLKIAKKLGNRQGECNDFGNLGNSYRSLGEYKKAINFHEQALKISKEIGDKLGEGIHLGNLGVTYGNSGNLNEAKSYYLQAIPLLASIKSPHAETFRQNLAEIEAKSSH